MDNLSLICRVAALILFVMAAANVAAPRWSLGWLGLAFWVGSTLVH